MLHVLYTVSFWSCAFFIYIIFTLLCIGKLENISWRMTGMFYYLIMISVGFGLLTVVLEFIK